VGARDLNYTDVVSTWLPWVYPLAIGIYAATSEEFLFRPVRDSVSVAHDEVKISGRRAAGISRGDFCIANYPPEPAYIRGIEVGLMAL